MTNLIPGIYVRNRTSLEAATADSTTYFPLPLRSPSRPVLHMHLQADRLRPTFNLHTWSSNNHFLRARSTPPLPTSSPPVSLGKALHSKAIFQETSPPTNAHTSSSEALLTALGQSLKFTHPLMKSVLVPSTYSQSHSEAPRGPCPALFSCES